MKSLRLRGSSGLADLIVTDEDEPTLGRGEILVRVAAVSLNYRDLAMATGTYPPEHLRHLVPGSDAAGEVVAVGDDVPFAVGERVMSTFHPRWFGGAKPAHTAREQYGAHRDGWLSELKVVHHESVVRIPDRLSYEQAATLPCAAVTAWNALTLGSAVRPGQTVLTLGTGGVSLFAVQLAHLSGARVVATTSTEEKAQVLRDLGADLVIDRRRDPAWGKTARAWSGGRGIDRVVEIGGAGTLPQSMRAVASGGEVAVIGFLDSANDTSIDFLDLFASGATYRVLDVGSRSDLIDLANAMDQSNLEPGTAARVGDI